MKNLIALSVLALILALTAIPVMAQTATSPCIFAMTDRPSFSQGDAVRISVALSNGQFCSTRTIENGGQRVGFGLLKQHTEVYQNAFAKSVPTKSAVIPGYPFQIVWWEQVGFKSGLVKTSRNEEMQDGVSFADLKAGKYAVLVTVYDEAGYDYQMALRFDIGVDVPTAGTLSLVDPINPPTTAGPEPVDFPTEEPKVYLRAGHTVVDESLRFSFGSDIGGKTATGFLYQGNGNFSLIHSTAFVTIGSLGDLPWVQATTPVKGWDLDNKRPVFACLKPEGAVAHTCAKVFDPSFPSREWHGFGNFEGRN
ncbi:MAG: hypothetical protein WC794_04365 [Candidatus Doudnabacteria bacterium]